MSREPTEVAPGYLSHQQFEPHVQWMRLAAVKRHREWDRSTPLSPANPEGHSYSQEEWDKNVADVRENGIKSPLIMHYDRDSHRALLGEGNHRLVWAEQAGHQAVPVRVAVAKSSNYLEGRASSRHDVIGEQKVPREGYVSADMKPNQVFEKDYYQGNPRAARELIVRGPDGKVVGK